MKTEQAESLKRGLTAVDRAILINLTTKQIEIHEQVQPGESKVVKQFSLLAKDQQPNWREHNETVLRTIHAETNGGAGRVVESKILVAWKSLGLADNSAKPNVEGKL